MCSLPDGPRRLGVWPEDKATEIWVLDEKFRTVAYSVGHLDKTLQRGIYKIRATAGSGVWEKVVVLDERDVNEYVPQLPFATPVPLPDTAQYNQVHEEAAHWESRRAHVEAGEGSAIFAFVRRLLPADRVGPATTAPHPAHDLALLDGEGEVVADLETAAASDWPPERSEPAWAGCNVLVEPGTYRLHQWQGDGTALAQTIVAAPGWQTQVFCLQGPHGPEGSVERADLSTAAIVYAKYDPGKEDVVGFDAGDAAYVKGVRLGELARLGLMQRRDVLPRDVYDMLWHKYRNPMAGIYGAHFLLMDEEMNRELFKTVIDNLRRILGQHPDVEALALRLEDAPTDPGYRFTVPPMLRRSWTLVIDATFQHAELVPRDSLAESVSDHLWGSGPWHLWQEATSAKGSSPLESTRGPYRGGDVPAFALDSYEIAIATQLALGVNLWEYVAEPPPELDDSTTQALMDVLNLPRSKVQARVQQLSEKIQRCPIQVDQALIDLPKPKTSLPYLSVAVLRLLENAVKYAQAGTVIRVSGADSPDGLTLTLEYYGHLMAEPAFAMTERVVAPLGGTVSAHATPPSPSLVTITLFVPHRDSAGFENAGP